MICKRSERAYQYKKFKKDYPKQSVIIKILKEVV